MMFQETFPSIRRYGGKKEFHYFNFANGTDVSDSLWQDDEMRVSAKT